MAAYITNTLEMYITILVSCYGQFSCQCDALFTNVEHFLQDWPQQQQDIYKQALKRHVTLSRNGCDVRLKGAKNSLKTKNFFFAFLRSNETRHNE